MNKGLILTVFIMVPFFMGAYNHAIADTSPTAFITPEDDSYGVCTPEVAISPSSAYVTAGDTQQFSASTTCGGEVLSGIYAWEISGGTSNTTNGDKIIYTAGNTSGTFQIVVTDTLNGNITDFADIDILIIVVDIFLEITPKTVLRSRWMWLPSIMLFHAGGANFAPFSTSPIYTPATSVIAMPALVLGPYDIWQIILVNPAWLAGTGDTQTESVMVSIDGVMPNIFSIELLPLLLDE